MTPDNVTPPLPLDMDGQTFRQAAHRLVDWIADYLEQSEQYPVLSTIAPGDVRKALPAEPPVEGESMTTILDDFENHIVPALTHWNHPGFFAYFGITASAPGVLADFLSAAINQQAMLWRTSPASTELEAVTLDWLRGLLGLPPEFAGVIYDTASVATLHGLAAAREAMKLDVRERGMFSLAPLRVYCSDHAHSSVDKAVLMLGLGHDNLVKIPVDDFFRMRPDALKAAVETDLQAGLRPMAVVATVGTTSTTSVDPVPAVADICEAHGMWLHIDAAYAGVAAMVPECRSILDGCERADSFVTNPHKWLFVPFDLSAFYCRRMDVVKSAFSLIPEYLRTGEDASVTNLMDTGIQLGRRFRSLKLWMVMRTFGSQGLIERLRHHMQLARWLADRIDEHDDFERVAPVPFSVVCFRADPEEWPAGKPTDQLNEALMNRLNRSGEVFLSHTKLHDRLVLRVAIGNVRTELRHIEKLWKMLQSEVATMVQEGYDA